MNVRSPRGVLFAGAWFLVVGGVLVIIGSMGISSDTATSRIATLLAGVVFAAVGAGILARRAWARAVGILAGVSVAVIGGLAMLFVTLMSTSVGIGFDNRLFLDPFAFFLVVLATAIACVAMLVRSGAWFRRGAEE